MNYNNNKNNNNNNNMNNNDNNNHDNNNQNSNNKRIPCCSNQQPDRKPFVQGTSSTALATQI